MNDLYDKFLSDLKNELLKRNITQEKLAYDIGVTPVTVCKFFRRKSVSMNLINKISKYIEYFDSNNLDEFFEKNKFYEGMFASIQRRKHEK